MKFRTQIPILKSDHLIDFDSKVVSLGSCFAVNIAQKFDYFQFRNTVNPFGILFHPMAIEKSIRWAIEGKTFDENDIFSRSEAWHCFDAHSDLSHSNKDTILQNLNASGKLLRETIISATHIIITFGTAWVYRNNQSGNPVANCHKVPQKEFSKELLSVDMIAESIGNIISLLQKANPDTNLIFTVSPVRHIKDGFVENQRSKSNLISGLHQALSQSLKPNTRQPTYFPSYEIMMDELRDYRFYAEDMLHPNQIAIDYIWERFSESGISQSAFPIMDEVASVRKGLAHRPFNPDSESHRAFMKSVGEKSASLSARFTWMVF